MAEESRTTAQSAQPPVPARPVRDQGRRATDGRAGLPTGERTLLEGLLHYAGIILRYKWFIIITSAVAAVGVVAFSIVSLRLPPERSPLPNVYTANAILVLQRGGGSATQSMLAALGMEAGAGGIDYGQLATLVLRSRSFLDAVVDENDIIGRYNIVQRQRTVAREVVSGSSTYGFDVRTGLLTIAYTDIDPVFAARMVQSQVTQLLRWFAQRVGTDRMAAIETIDQTVKEVENRIQEIEGRIEAFQQQYGVTRIEEIAQTQTQLLAQFQAQLLDLDLQISNQLQVSRLENDPALVALRTQQQNLLNLVRRIEGGYTGGTERLPPRDQLPALAAEYSRLAAELQIQSRIYQVLTEQYEVARLTADTNPAFTVLEPVEVPEEKSGPSRGQLSMTVTAGAFFASIVLALLIDMIRKIAKDPAKRRILRAQESDTE